MMIKFLAHGEGSAVKAAAYLLAEKDHLGHVRADVKTLRGNAKIFTAIADSCGFKQRYTSGVIAFALEDDPTKEEIEEVLDSFEELAFAGLEKDDYHMFAVEHTEDDGSKHIHILVPRVHLSTGKSLNIAPPNHSSVFYPWRDLWNETKGWASPKDPNRRRRIQPKYGALVDKQMLKMGVKHEINGREYIADLIETQIRAGIIETRLDVENYLRNDVFTGDIGVVSRVVKNSISIKLMDENGELSRPHRLEGAFFDADFSGAAWLARRKEAGARETDGRVISRSKRRDKDLIGELESRVAEIKERRGARHSEYFAPKKSRAGKPQQTANQDAEISGEKGDETSTVDSQASDLVISDRNDWSDLSELHTDTEKPLERADQGHQEREWGSLFDLREPSMAELRKAREASVLQEDLGESASDDTARNNAYTAARAANDDFYKCVKRFTGAVERSKRSYDTVAANTIATITRIEELKAGVKRKMTNDDRELECFKTDINLVQYALSKGYEVDVKRTHSNSTSMKKADDRIVVRTSTQGHGIYFTVGTDGADSGTIIDFVQRKAAIQSLGRVRQELRPWAGIRPQNEAVKAVKSLVESNPELYKKPPETSDDEATFHLLRAEYQNLTAYLFQSYLLEDRALSPSTLKLFAKQLRQERGIHKNPCFLHRRADGQVTGWEQKNKDFTGFSRGGKKSLFMQKADESKQTQNVIVFESAIDAMSFAELEPNANDLYVAIGGAPNPSQYEILRDVINQNNAHLCIATDNDDAGEILAKNILEKAGELKQGWSRLLPEGKDWNDDLKANLKQKEKENKNGIQSKPKSK